MPLVRHFAIAGIGFALGAGTATGFAADRELKCTGLSFAQARVLEQSYQGVDTLRRYVLITRPVHQIGMAEVVESLDAWRSKAQCSKVNISSTEPPAPASLARAGD
jgi:hypothetical protein